MVVKIAYIYIYICVCVCVCVCVLQLKGCIIYEQENKACKLKKSLYDLNQDPKQWHEK